MSLFEWQKLVVVMYTPDNTEVQIGSFPCESSERVGPLKSAEEDGEIFFSLFQCHDNWKLQSLKNQLHRNVMNG